MKDSFRTIEYEDKTGRVVIYAVMNEKEIFPIKYIICDRVFLCASNIYTKGIRVMEEQFVNKMINK